MKKKYFEIFIMLLLNLSIVLAVCSHFLFAIASILKSDHFLPTMYLAGLRIEMFIVIDFCLFYSIGCAYLAMIFMILYFHRRWGIRE